MLNTTKIERKRNRKKIYHVKAIHKEVATTILIPEKVDFNTGTTNRDKDVYPKWKKKKTNSSGKYSIPKSECI